MRDRPDGIVAVGDIHGNRRALDDLLAQLRVELAPSDTVVFLGDYVDRGPDSKACIETILRFARQVRNEVITLMGNHEEWLLQTMADHCRHSWLLGMDAMTTIASYSEDAARIIRAAARDAGIRLASSRVPLPYDEFFRHVPPDHVDFFKRLRLYHAAAGAVFVHGGVDPDVADLGCQPAHALVWGTERFPVGYGGPATIIYGHWDNAEIDSSGWPRPAIGAHAIGIDTIAHGVLTAYRWPDGRVFQSARYVQA